jgi:endonuclease-3
MGKALRENEGGKMMHPLIELAKETCYLGSHIDTPLIETSPGKDSQEFILAANALVHDLERYPHAFVLACILDTSVAAEVAWTIPQRVKEALGTFAIEELYKVDEEYYVELFSGERKWHRYPARSAKFFYEGVKRIVENEQMDGNASAIWEGKPSSQAVVLRFMEFLGCGFKIGNMAPNLLYRYFGVEFSDYCSIDIAPDVHTTRVFSRLGLTPATSNAEAAKIYTICSARELNPEFPGIVDGICWEVGRNYCSPRNPKCFECLFMRFCKFYNDNLEKRGLGDERRRNQ